jgi:hypothetical protein
MTIGFSRLFSRLFNRHSFTQTGQLSIANAEPPDAFPELITLEDEEAIRSGRARVIGTTLINLRIVAGLVPLPPGQSWGFTDTLCYGGLNPGTAF